MIHVTQGTNGKTKKTLNLQYTCCEDSIFEETSQHLIRVATTLCNFVSSGYWYLMAGPGPSSSATNINVAGTFNCKKKFQLINNNVTCNTT